MLTLIIYIFQVIAVARRRERLESLAKSLTGKKGQFHPFVADITKSDEVIKVFKWAKENVGLVHILINNAGQIKLLPLINMKTEDMKSMFDLNVLALTLATREALKIFKENAIRGHIININSVVGHWVLDFPGNSIYVSTKHAVTAFTESTYFEIKNMKLGAKATVSFPFCSSKELNVTRKC